jgi:hypothetical protein
MVSIPSCIRSFPTGSQPAGGKPRFFCRLNPFLHQVISYLRELIEDQAQTQQVSIPSCIRSFPTSLFEKTVSRSPGLNPFLHQVISYNTCQTRKWKQLTTSLNPFLHQVISYAGDSREVLMCFTSVSIPSCIRSFPTLRSSRGSARTPRLNPFLHQVISYQMAI